MIRSFNIIEPNKTHIPWMARVPALEVPRTFTFKPGLNILWGKNGSGKSTVLKAMAQLLHCEQSGNPVLTLTSLQDLFSRYNFSNDEDLVKSLKLSHDGQGTRFFDPSVAVGLIGGMAGFDYDFGLEGVQNATFKGSAGQTTMFRFEKVIQSIMGGKKPSLERRGVSHLNPEWTPRLKIAESFLKGSGKSGQPTVLLDEPERSFDLPHQVSVWRFIRAFSDRIQFIVASHSLYALNIPGVNYIELDPGYLDLSIRCLKVLSVWTNEEPKPPPAEVLKQLKQEK